MTSSSRSTARSRPITSSSRDTARSRAFSPPDAKHRGDPAHPAFRIADWPFYLITRTANRYEMDMENALKRIDMDLPSWRAMMLLHECSPSSVGEIAERAVIRLSTMTRVIQRLEKRGFATVSRRAADARVTDVYITAEGEAVVGQVREVASRIYQAAFKDLNAAEIETLNGLLLRVFDNL